MIRSDSERHSTVMKGNMTQLLRFEFTPRQLCSCDVRSPALLIPFHLFAALLASADGEWPYQFKGASSVKKDVIAWADSKVMGYKQSVLQVKLLACHPLPLLIKFSNINDHLQSTWLHLTADTHTAWSACCFCTAHAVPLCCSLIVCTT